jgi:hypothetical protein
MITKVKTMFEKPQFVIVLALSLVLVLSACGGGAAAPTQAPTDDASSSSTGSQVSFGVADQLFTATAPEGYTNTSGVLSNGEIAVGAAQAPLSGVDMETYASGVAAALGDMETAEANGRTVYYVAHDTGVTLWVAPDDSNVISLSATQISANPADFIDDLLMIAGSITKQ